MNLTILSGYLGDNPDVRTTKGGKHLTKFRLGVRRPFSKNETDWFNCAAWEDKADLAGKYLTKGSHVLLRGRVETSTYEKDGQKTTRTGIIVENIEFLDTKSGEKSTESQPAQNAAPAQSAPAPAAAPAAPAAQAPAPAASGAISDDDIPF